MKDAMAVMTTEHAIDVLEAQTERQLDSHVLPDILYIMGTGRSGTTILEILLANNPGFAGVGEVNRIFRHGFLEDRTCACGRPASRCDLWSAVLSSNGWSRNDLPGLAAELEKRESHRRFPLLWAGLFDREFSIYREANEALFRSVSLATRCRVVVDSSKYAGRALLLARCFPEKVKVLCITRSAAGIISAFQKKNDVEQRPKGVLAAAAYYLYVVLSMRLARSRLKGRCFAIRFEDLNRDPAAVLEKIEAWSGYSLAAARERIAAHDWFDVCHIVTGNRLRKAGRVKFEPASGEKTASKQGISTRLLAPALEAYRKVMGF